MGIEIEEEDMEIWMGRVIKEVLPAITVIHLRDDTDKDPELKPLLEEKRTGEMIKKTTKGTYGKLWPEIRERDGILTKAGKTTTCSLYFFTRRDRRAPNANELVQLDKTLRRERHQSN